MPSSAEAPSNLATRVRALRVGRDWSLKELARRSGVSQSMLSQIERGAANPTVAVALATATALGVSLDELLQVAPAQGAVEVIRRSDDFYLYRSDAHCEIRTLSPLTADRPLEFYEIRLQGRAALRSAAHFAGTTEHLTVLSGKVRVEAGDRGEVLERGDSAAYPADVPHAIVNLRSTVSVVYLIDTVPGAR